MNPRQILRKLYSANIFSLLLFVKFGFLIGYTWIVPHQRDLFGEYTLAIGLTSAFFIFAGMRARFYVMKSVAHLSQLVELCLVILLLGIAMAGAVFWLNRESALLLLILLVAGGKFLEMFLDAGTSFIQNERGREEAFRILNQHGYMVVAAFVLLVPLGLEWAIAAELALLLITVGRQWLAIARAKSEPLRLSLKSTFRVTRGGLAYTLGASLNSAQLTAFLYFAQANYSGEITLLLAKIFAAQAVFSRLITGNNFYFKNALHGALRRFSHHIVIFTICCGGALIAALLASEYWQAPESWALIAVGALFTIINVVAVAIRQHVMVVAGIERLIVLHGFELTALVVGLLFLPIGPHTALAMLGALRLMRLSDMMRVVMQTDLDLAQARSAQGDSKR